MENSNRGNLAKIREAYLGKIENLAKSLVKTSFTNKKNAPPMTSSVLSFIKTLYSCAKLSDYEETDKFTSAYHNPITSDFEFFIARLLYHYSDKYSLGWKIYLRKQKKKLAPDIRIAVQGKGISGERTIGIIEIKVKAGWIKPLFSKDCFKKGLKRKKEGKSDFDPKVFIKKEKEKLENYANTYNIKTNRLFVLLPSLVLVHLKSSKRELADYKKDFGKQLNLLRKNLVIMSNNLGLDLSSALTENDFEPTREFEDMLNKLMKFTII